MIRNKKAMLFCSQIILTGALLTGAPCLASGATGANADENTETDNNISDSVFGSSDTAPESEEPDHSGEGQIHKPESLDHRTIGRQRTAPGFYSGSGFCR